jgi:hypothetical protein
MTESQKQMIFYVAGETLSLDRLPNGDEKARRLNVIARYAYALFHDLQSAGLQLRFSNIMLRNRGTTPNQVEFFVNTSALQDFCGLVTPHLS